MIDHSICEALSEEMIDRILADSFPASDPPPWTAGRENRRCSGFVDDSTATMGNAGVQYPLRGKMPGDSNFKGVKPDGTEPVGLKKNHL